jgi:dTDP-4-amino-4,6-dideoxygalactose transaminase
VFRGARSVLTGTADRLFATGLTLPSGSALTADDVARVERVVVDFLGAR